MASRRDGILRLELILQAALVLVNRNRNQGVSRGIPQPGLGSTRAYRDAVTAPLPWVPATASIAL
jgi:hypothetical protein